MPDSLLEWIRPEIRELAAYHVADAEGLVKLDAMENPYALEGGDAEAWNQAVRAAAINRYPDPSARSLKSAMAQLMQPPAGSEMLLGNGSDEIIQMLAMAVSGPERVILSFEPGFVMYRMIAGFVGMRYVGVPLNEACGIDAGMALAAIEQHQPALIFIAYPNNPTANCFDDRVIERIIEAAPGIVVLDEAYHPFAQRSWMHRLDDYQQLMVMRTVSKMGLAGLRLGVLFGHPMLIGEIDKLRLPYNINSLTQAAATSILKNSAVLDEQAAAIRAERELMMAALEQLDGVAPYPSDANFILFRVRGKAADDVFETIREQGVLIKNMRASEGLLANCLRVTVGTPQENQAFLEALRAALSS